MKIVLNGEPREVGAAGLSALLIELGYEGAAFATAVNERFVPVSDRARVTLRDGDRLEVLSPRQGG